MNILHFSDNLIQLRREKGITQEELADFMGVTKASVSKWETKQSLPDILLLPRLAAYFDVTLDALLGYEPQLSKEQIQKIYHDLAFDFAALPFEETMEKSRQLVKKYYSCYSFLLQICVLWLNHYMMAENQKRRLEILSDASNLCSHIISDCKEMGLCSDAVILKATIDLQLGKTQEAIDILEDVVNPCGFHSQSDTLLIQAYQLAGETKKADSMAHISMFLHLISLTGIMVQYLASHPEDTAVCDETIRRIDSLTDSFQLNRLHPNSTAQFQYQAAVNYCLRGNTAEALKRLKSYAADVCFLLTEDHLNMHKDDYFFLLDKWYEESDLGSSAPRDKKLILQGAVQALRHPAFSILMQNPLFLQIEKSLKEGGADS